MGAVIWGTSLRSTACVAIKVLAAPIKAGTRKSRSLQARRSADAARFTILTSCRVYVRRRGGLVFSVMGMSPGNPRVRGCAGKGPESAEAGEPLVHHRGRSRLRAQAGWFIAISNRAQHFDFAEVKFRFPEAGPTSASPRWRLLPTRAQTGRSDAGNAGSTCRRRNHVSGKA